jgi:hypothetical protein
MSRIWQRRNILKRSEYRPQKVIMAVKKMTSERLEKWYLTKMPNRKQRKIIKNEMEKRVY